MLLSRTATARLVAQLGAMALALAGCQREVVPVSGQVTVNGQPLVGAVITFQPRRARQAGEKPGAGSIGRTDDQGRFVLRQVTPSRYGAVVGEHAVMIIPAETWNGPPLPRAWQDGSRRFVVPPGGTRQANFEITLPDRAAP